MILDPGALMRTVCAWCKKVMSDGPPPTSHGMCKQCELKFAAEVEALEEARN
jgi:hypothetical protein